MKFPVNFPVSREFSLETGSTRTASATTAARASRAWSAAFVYRCTSLGPRTAVVERDIRLMSAIGTKRTFRRDQSNVRF